MPKAYQQRTKYRRIYRYLPLLTLSNLFRVNSRWVEGDRFKVSGPTIRIPLLGHPEVLSGRPPYRASVAQSPNSWGADIVGEVQRDPTTAPAGVAPDYARLGKPVSQLEELAAGTLHGEVSEGGDSGASQYRISSTRRR